MKFQFHSTEQEDVQPDLDWLAARLIEHGLTDDAAGRQEVLGKILAAAGPREETWGLRHLRHLVVQYDPDKSAEIDAWLRAVVVARPEVAGDLYEDCLTESLKLDGNAALLRAGLDVAIAVPGVDLSIAASTGQTSKMVDASPIAAMLCYLDPEGWAHLEQKGLLPRFDVVPYAGRFQQLDGTFVELNLVDYLLKTNPGAMEHLFVLHILNKDSPEVQRALADGAVRMITQRSAAEKQGKELERAALLIGAGADLLRVAQGIKDEPLPSLPSLLASVQNFEYERYIIGAAKAIAAAGKREDLPADLLPVFDLNFREPGGTTPLHLAAGYGYPEVVEVLAAAGADINARDDDLKTPLHEAALSAGPDTVEILLGARVDIDARTRQGLTAEDLATNNRQHAVAQMIAAHRAKKAVADVLKRAKSTSKISH